MPVPFDTFAQLELRIGRILEVDDVPMARKPLYKIKVDFGQEGQKQCVAGIKTYYSKEQLKGKMVVAVVNLDPRPIAGVVSECMLLASFNESDLSLLVPDKEIQVGSKVA
jgi:export-related chaperone CsaA